MDNQFTELLNQITSEPGVTGILCSDKNGLCLAARGTGNLNTSGYLTSILKRAQKISEEEDPTIQIETDSSNVLIKSNGDITLAIIKQP